MHAPEHATEERPEVLPKSPAGQGVQLEAPAAEKVPAIQERQVASEAAPVTEEAVPAGQAVALMELKGQKKPAGHVEQLKAPATE